MRISKRKISYESFYNIFSILGTDPEYSIMNIQPLLGRKIVYYNIIVIQIGEKIR